MDHSEAVAAMLASAPFVNRDPHRFRALVMVLEGLLERIPGERLVFRPDRDLWRTVEGME